MATPQQIRDAVDTKLAQLWTSIQNREDAYFAANGRYWQGVRTHVVTPADGIAALPDVGTTVPSYQGNPWPSTILSQSLPMAIEIHQYDGPQGKGYQAFVYVVIAGQTWARSAQVGPEAYRVTPWTNIGVL